eukprot:COSAG01_NODE_63557_length_279_cov_1.155556_1_plen_45_part_10
MRKKTRGIVCGLREHQQVETIPIFRPRQQMLVIGQCTCTAQYSTL